MTAAAPSAAPGPRTKRPGLLARVPAAFVRSVLKGHSSLGLAFAAAIYLVCLTGTLAVFTREFQRWENPHAPQVTEVTPQAVQRALAGVLRAHGGAVEHAFIYPATADLPWLAVSIDERQWVADAQGRIAGEARTPWTTFMAELHTRLHLPHTWGRFLVGLIGVALLSSLISGVLAHPRVFRDAFHLRLGGSRRLQEADLHNRFGIWALPFHLVVSLTGAFLGLTTLVVGVLGFALFQGDDGKVYGLFFPAELKDDPAAAPLIDIAPLLADVQRRVPGGRILYIALEHPTERGGGALFEVQTAERGLIHSESYAYNRQGLYHTSKLGEATLGQKVVAATGPLHFGWFGGGLVKIVYGLLGLAMTHLAVSGVTIWLARRRDKGRPAPAWERIWAACVWSQPAGIAAAAALAMAWPGATVGSMLTIWGGVSVVFLLLAAAWEARRLSLLGSLATAAMLAIAVLLHLLGRYRLGGDSLGLVVDLALAATAFLLVTLQLRTLRRRGEPQERPAQAGTPSAAP